MPFRFLLFDFDFDFDFDFNFDCGKTIYMPSNIFYNSQHSPAGAFASFTLGFKGASGGLGVELAGPACQNVWIGAESSTPGQYQALPFYAGALKSGADAEPPPQDIWKSDEKKRAAITPFADGEITRETTPACDSWRAGDLEFKIYSPFLSIPNPNTADPSEVKRALIPAVFVEFSLDNTAGKSPRRAFFGYEGNDPYSGMRRFSLPVLKAGGGVPEKISGVGQGRVTAVFTDARGVDCALAFSVNELLAAENIADKLPFGLGTTGLALMTAPAGERRTWRFAVCFYRAGVVTSGREASYLYTHHFKNIEDVARYGLENFDFYKQAAADRDKMFLHYQLSEDRRFLLSQAVKSYYGSTELLVDEYNKPLWIVNEGGYRMINTLDLAVDHLFFEMRMNPWVVHSIIEQYARSYYWYNDEVKNGAGEKFPGGRSFAHDMGVANVFSPGGRSAYELRSLKGCYSYMSQEQLVNWILCAGVYWKGTGDDTALKESQYFLEDCISSMVNRDGPNGKDLDGVMDLDSCMTGSGAEITTYDNVDAALGRARRNSYLAVKCWAAYLALEAMFGALGPSPTESAKSAQTQAAEQAERCAATILKYVRPDGTIPALLEEGNKATTLSLVDGLVFPYVMGMFDDQEFINKYGGFVNALKKHFEAALNNGCKFADGAWKMSLTSGNSWPSKTFLCQFISEKIFGHDADAKADRAHVSWLTDPQNAIHAFSDQMLAGKVCGSRYYPRGVTAVLWV